MVEASYVLSIAVSFLREVSMSEAAQSILAAAMALPERERLEIAVQLLDCLPAETIGLSLDDPDLLAKLEQRSGTQDGEVTWEELQRSVSESP
jgi:hypothetical protein